MEITHELLISMMSPGRDQFDRKYPIKLQLRDGSVIYGNIKAISNFDGPRVDILIIESIEDWMQNVSNDIATRQSITLNYSTEIANISIFKEY